MIREVGVAEPADRGDDHGHVLGTTSRQDRVDRDLFRDDHGVAARDLAENHVATQRGTGQHLGNGFLGRRDDRQPVGPAALEVRLDQARPDPAPRRSSSVVHRITAGLAQEPPVGLGIAAGGTRSTMSCVNVGMVLPSGQRVPVVLAARDRADAVAHDPPEHDHAAVRRAPDARARGPRSSAGSTARRSRPDAAGARRRGGRPTGRSPAAPPAPGVSPHAGSTWASSKFVVCVSSIGTAQRMITGRLAALASVASSISRVNWCTLGGMKSQTRTHTRSPIRRVAM